MKQRVKKSGFTLVELLVTLSIFLVMTSVVLARYRSFSINADFANTVEGIVLSVREAQVYGSGSRAAGASITCGSPASEFSCAYGVRFMTGGTSYVVFVDRDDSKTYTGAPEMIQSIALPAGVSLSTTLSPLDIIFKRPFPDATINNNPANTSASVTVSDSRSGKLQTISITSAGQISVQ